MKHILLAVILFILTAAPASADGRGIALACGGLADARAAGVANWWMDWSHSTREKETDNPKHFTDPTWVPMIRAWADFRASYPCTKWDTFIMVYSQAMTYPGRYWLLGNEANELDQDNYTAVEAAHVYGSMGRIVRMGDPTAKLLLGGMNSDEAGVEFTQEVLSFWPQDVPLAGLQWHVYLDNGWSDDYTLRINLPNGKAAVDRAVAFTKARNPDWEVWVTEWGILGYHTQFFSVADVAAYVRGMSQYMEERVDRQAYFTWTGQCMPFFSWNLGESPEVLAAYRGD